MESGTGFSQTSWCISFFFALRFLSNVSFLSEQHILEDVNRCINALQDRDLETVDRTAGQIHGRTKRVGDVVKDEMENYQKGPYTDNVMRTVNRMNTESKKIKNKLPKPSLIWIKIMVTKNASSSSSSSSIIIIIIIIIIILKLHHYHRHF